MRQLLIGALLLAPFGAAFADETSEDVSDHGPEDAVRTFFAGMKANDWDLAETVLIEDAVFYGYRDIAGELSLSRITAAEYLERMSDNQERLLERIWDIETLIDGRLATVWTPYDFYVNDTLSHCGTNSFSLIRLDDGWRVASVTYSMLTEDCPPSPLGPHNPQ